MPTVRGMFVKVDPTTGRVVQSCTSATDEAKVDGVACNHQRITQALKGESLTGRPTNASHEAGGYAWYRVCAPLEPGTVFVPAEHEFSPAPAPIAVPRVHMRRSAVRQTDEGVLTGEEYDAALKDAGVPVYSRAREEDEDVRAHIEQYRADHREEKRAYGRQHGPKYRRSKHGQEVISAWNHSKAGLESRASTRAKAASKYTAEAKGQAKAAMAMAKTTSAIWAVLTPSDSEKLGAHLASGSNAEVLPKLTATTKDGDRPRAYGHSAPGIAEIALNVKTWLAERGVDELAFACATNSSTSQEHCEKQAYARAVAQLPLYHGQMHAFFIKSRPPCGYRADPKTGVQCECCWDWLKKLSMDEPAPLCPVCPAAK